MKPRTQPAAALPVLSHAEIAKLKKSLEFINDETQRVLDRCNRQPVYDILLRKLANNFTMMSRIHKELGDNEEALRDGMHAIEMLGRIDRDDQNFGDFYKITQFYRDLAEISKHDKTMAAIFQFGCDFFGGKKSVCFSSLDKIIKSYCKQKNVSLMHHSALTQLLALIEDKHSYRDFPDNVLKDELNDLYYQKRFAEISRVVKEKGNNLLDQFCDEMNTMLDNLVAPEVQANVEMRAAQFEQPVRATASAGGMFAPEGIVKPGHVAALAEKMKNYPIMK